jgi:radical SAM protein with 4Fe4S-binding SPASM domain
MDPYDALGIIEKERSKRLYHWMKGQPQPPIKLTIFITQMCNLKCLFCGVPVCIEEGKFDFSKELSRSKWLEVVKEAIKMGVMDWELLGVGEALIKADATTEIIELVKKKTPISYFLLTTNGTLFTDEIIERIVKAGLDRIQFSIDGPNPEIHDYLRNKKGTFRSAISAIKKITAFKHELNKYTPILSINMVLNAKNFDKVDQMINLASKIGVEEIMITPMRVDPDNIRRIKKGNLIMSKKQIEEFHRNVSEYFQLAKKKKVRLQLLVTRGKEIIKGPTDDIIGDNFSNKFLCAPCYEPWYNLIIDPLGNVGPCITSASFASKSLNVTKMSLKEIWYSKEFDEIRKKRLNKIPLPQCSHCTVTEMRKQIKNHLIDYLKKINELDKFK